MLIGLLLWLTTQKALQRDIPEGYLPVEPIKAGQVMTPQNAPPDTITTYYELIGDTNSGFEYSESQMDWVKNDENVGSRGKIKLNSEMYPTEELYPFEGDYSAEIQIRGTDEGIKKGYFEINLSSKDTLKFGELDSLNVALMRGQYRIPLTEWDFRIDLIGEKNNVLDTISLAYGTEEEDTKHRFYKNLIGEDTLSLDVWEKRNFSKRLKELIKENNLEEHKMKRLRFYVSANLIGSSLNATFVDEVQAHFTRQTITGVTEQPRINPGYELSDVLLESSNQYNAHFPKRGTFTIYEGASGRRVREPVTPINVDGLTQLDFSDLCAGVYVGVYEPQEGRRQVVKIIKAQ